MDGLITFGYIVLAIVILLVMVLIHEFGHYIAGVLLKFKITEFAVGLGPVVAIPKFWDKTAMARIRARRLESRQEGYVPEAAGVINHDYLFRLQHRNRRGENVSLRWFPLGGFCSFADEDGTGGNTESGFYSQKPWKRLIVQAAGAVFNIISAIFFCMLLVGIVGYSVPKVQEIKFDPDELHAEGYESILQVGDEIVAVGGKRVTVLNPYAELVTFEKGDEYVLTVRRAQEDGTQAEKEVCGKIIDFDYIDEDGKQQTATGMGVTVSYLRQHHGFWQSIGYAFPYTFKMAGQVLSVFGQMLTGQISLSSLGGPITTVSVIGEYTRQSAEYLLLLLPLIAVNLGVFNLLPIPSLDGAHIVFTLIEMIFRKPVPRRIEGYIHGVGLVVLLGFVILIDVLHFVIP